MSSEWSNRQSKAHYLLKERRSRRKFQEETTKAELSPTAIVEEVDPPFRSESKVASRIDLAPIQQIQSPLKVLVASAPKAEVPRSPDRYRESSSAYQTHQESAITFTTNDLESPSRRQQSPARTCQSLHQLNSPEENQDSLCSPNQFSLQRSRSRQVQQCDQIQSSVVMEERQLIILISVGVSDRNQATHQDRSLTIMKGKDTPFEVVDGMDPNQKKRRNQLFEISGIRGNYPQFFFSYPDGSITFVGGWEKIEEINENSTLPPEILDKNPNIEIWCSFFHGVVEKFSS